MRPITPVVGGYYSYAVAWASKRTDGHPYEIIANLRNLGLTYEKGYIITVSKRPFVSAQRVKHLQFQYITHF